jgi:plastocyanin
MSELMANRWTPRRWTRCAGAVLAAVVMTVGFTACGGGGDDDGGKAYVEPKGASTETISIEAGNFYFKPKNPTANAGIATIKLTAASGIHDFVFDGAYPGFRLEADGGGGSQSKKIDLKPGKYTFYCSITGHRAQGMEGTLTVK